MWREQLEINFCEIKCKDEEAKKASLLKSLGSETYSVLRALCKILEDNFTPSTIIFRERKIFHSAAKMDTETISQWYARIKKVALHCKFRVHLNAMLLDQFIIGLPPTLFEKLCEEDETITLERALRKTLIMESKMAKKQKQ